MFGFLKKPKPSVDRYEGKPFLKLVDSFVLDSIGELESNQAELLEQMTPKLQETYQCQGTWQEIVLQQLGFDSSVSEAIREMWAKNQQIAKQNSQGLEPMQFVEMFVANNIPMA